jgi:NADPH:quinone reductase-like Zn-dependent oxidoreductase
MLPNTLPCFSLRSGIGALSELTVVGTLAVAHRKPKNVSHAEAACFPVAGMISYSLVRYGGLKMNAAQRDFINSGSSGTGTLAIQVCSFLVSLPSTLSDN